jgi:hypothetical protein
MKMKSYKMKNWRNSSIYRVLKYSVKKSETDISCQLRNSEYETCLIIFRWYNLDYKNIFLELYDFKPSSCKGDRWLVMPLCEHPRIPPSCFWTSWMWAPLYSGLWILFLGPSAVHDFSKLDTCLSSSYFFRSVKSVYVYAHWFNYYDTYTARIKESIENNTEWYTQEISPKENNLNYTYLLTSSNGR